MKYLPFEIYNRVKIDLSDLLAHDLPHNYTHSSLISVMAAWRGDLGWPPDREELLFVSLVQLIVRWCLLPRAGARNRNFISA
jgi:hypothetical protein